jgi:hypothetical protein
MVGAPERGGVNSPVIYILKPLKANKTSTDSSFNELEIMPLVLNPTFNLAATT